MLPLLCYFIILLLYSDSIQIGILVTALVFFPMLKCVCDSVTVSFLSCQTLLSSCDGFNPKLCQFTPLEPPWDAVAFNKCPMSEHSTLIYNRISYSNKIYYNIIKYNNNWEFDTDTLLVPASSCEAGASRTAIASTVVDITTSEMHWVYRGVSYYFQLHYVISCYTAVYCICVQLYYII